MLCDCSILMYIICLSTMIITHMGSLHCFSWFVFRVEDNAIDSGDATCSKEDLLAKCLLPCSGLVQKLHDPTEVGLLSLLLFDLSPIHGTPSFFTLVQNSLIFKMALSRVFSRQI